MGSESGTVAAQVEARKGAAIAGSLVAIVLVLAGLGLIMVYSSSAVPAGERHDDAGYFLKRQIVWIALGMTLLLGISRFRHDRLRPHAFFLLLVSLSGLAFALFTPFGREMNHARRWLEIGGFRFEPSEAVKLALVLFLANRLASREARASVGMQGLGGSLVAAALACALLLGQPDFGTSVVVVSILAGGLFLAGVRMRALLALGLLVAAGMALSIVISPYRLDRVRAFLDPWENAQGVGYPMVQSMIAFGSGGLLGRGLGLGMQKLGYIPNAHTDFVLAIVGEELGFVGVASVLVLYGLLLVQGARIAIPAGDPFGLFLGAGLTWLIGIQVSINVWTTLALVPTKGQPLPFLSYGGSSFLANAAAVGILISIARGSRPRWLVGAGPAADRRDSWLADERPRGMGSRTGSSDKGQMSWADEGIRR